MNAMPHGKRDERNRTVFDRLLLILENKGPKAKFFFIFDERCCII